MTTGAGGAHSHTYTQYTLDQEVNETGSGVRSLNKNNSQGATFNTSSVSTHTHSITSDGVSGTNMNLPPYYALAFIIYVGI